MRIQAKPSLLVALLLSSSYLLLSTCGRSQHQSEAGREEIPVDAVEVQPSVDTEGEEPAAAGLVGDTDGIPAGAANPSPHYATGNQPVPPSTPRPSSTPQVPQTTEKPKPPPVPLTVVAGETIDIEFRQSLSSHTSQAGQTFRVRVTQPVRVGARIAIPAGSTIQGRVIEAEPAKKIGGRARLALDFQSLTLVNGATYTIDAVFAQAGKSQTGKDAAIIGGATLGGAVLGKQVGGDTGTIIGAVAGGIGGAFAAKKTKGKPVEIPAGTFMILELTQPVTIDVLP